MKNPITLFLVFFSVVAYAQPEITQSNLPQLGDQVIIGICSNAVNPGSAGAMQTWDMSDLMETEEQSFTYIVPTEAPRADSFPNANLCAVSWLDDYSFYKVSPTALTVEGHVVTLPTNDTSVFVFSDSEQILELPYAMNDSFLDSFEGTFYTPGIGALQFDGSLDFEADGYGTLILPNATYNNVVRYHFYREQTNYFGGFPAGTQTKEQWAWVSADYRFWLLLMEQNWDGFSTTEMVWYDKNPYPATTGYQINEINTNAIYPNPVKSGHQINISWGKNEQAHISVLRLDGSMVSEQTLGLTIGINYHHCPPMSAGLYIIKIETASTSFSQKLSVLH